MEVLWIEDFGSVVSPVLLSSELFGELIPEKVFDSVDADLVNMPEQLAGVFSANSACHGASLCRHYQDYRHYKEQHLLPLSNDVVVIDINLSHKVDPNWEIPTAFRVDPDGFHKKAGFYIYNDLIHSGFPPDNICFLTGEAGSTFKEFKEHCEGAMLAHPQVFEKASEYPKFRAWLSKRARNPYATLRRAVLRACADIKRIVELDSSKIQFNDFIRSERGKPIRQFTSIETCDYLDSLLHFFPAIEPSGDEKRRLYRLFVRTLAQEWEDAASPVNLNLPTSQKKNVLRALGWIMKNVRNWMSHNAAIDQLDERDVAFLIFVNMRAMFDLGPTTVNYEKQLLSLFAGAEGSLLACLDETELRNRLLESYKLVKERIIYEIPREDAIKFSEMVNNLAKNGIAPGKVNFVRTLYQMFWHGLSETKLKNCAPATDQRTGSKNLGVYFSFDCSLNKYCASQNQPDDFLHQLALAIYARSFQQ